MTSFARAPRPDVSQNSWISDSSYITTSQYFITNAGDASFSGLPSQYFISNYEDRPQSILGYPKATVSAMSSEYCISKSDISTSDTQLTSTWTIISSHYADESEKDGYISNSRETVSAMPSKYYISSDSCSISEAMTFIPSSFYSSMSDSTLLSDTEAEDVQSVIKQLEEIDYSRISDPCVSDSEDNPCPNGCSVQSKLDYLNVVNDGGKSKANRKLQAERVLIAPRIQKVEYVRATRGWSGICKFQPRERRGTAKLIRFYDTVDFKPPEYQKVLVLTDFNTSR